MGSKSKFSIHNKVIIATVIGNGFVWFDFTCYGFFARIIAKLFFPGQNELMSLLLAMATFGVGFVMRPVGGILLGIYSDRVGRKQALWVTMLLMSIGTGLIGLSPTFEQVGVLAPILIVVARLIQGFSAGAEMSTATAFLTQYTPVEKRGYYTSWIQAGVGFAIFLGAAIGTMLTYLSDENLYGWGWRLPFLFGILIGPIGFYIHNHVGEQKEAAKQEVATPPFVDIIKQYPRAISISFSLVILWTVCIYVLLFYIPIYSQTAVGLPVSNGFIAVMLGGVVNLLFAPIFGALSDRFGRKRFLSLSAGFILISAYPMFLALNTYQDLTSLVVFQLVFGLSIACYQGVVLAAITELFPKKILSTGFAIAHSFAVTIFGGFAAMIITWLIVTTESNLAPAYYVITAAAISLIGTLFIQNEPKPSRQLKFQT